MFRFRKKSKSELLTENENLKLLARVSLKYIDKYKQILKCLSETSIKTNSRTLYMIPSDDGKLENADFYFIDFHIITDQTALSDYEVEYISYKITTQYSDKYEEVCKLNAGVQSCPNGQKQIELVTLDCHETRKGHASKLVATLVEYARINGFALIYGDLWGSTGIGIENLKSFYENNGFKVGQNSFSMHLE